MVPLRTPTPTTPLFRSDIVHDRVGALVVVLRVNPLRQRDED